MRIREAAFRFVRSSHARVKSTLTAREGLSNPSDFAVHVPRRFAALALLIKQGGYDGTLSRRTHGGFYATARYSLNEEVWRDSRFGVLVGLPPQEC
jgi:hypothetical protein